MKDSWSLVDEGARSGWLRRTTKLRRGPNLLTPLTYPRRVACHNARPPTPGACEESRLERQAQDERRR